MQLDKLIHVIKLIGRKYHLTYIVPILVSFLMLLLLQNNWGSVKLSLEVDTPFFKTSIPTSDIYLKGWEIMGYFGFFSFLPIVLLFIKPLKKFVWIVAVGILPITLVNGMNLYEILDWILGQTMTNFKMDIKIYTSFYSYLALIAFLSIFTYIISSDEF